MNTEITVILKGSYGGSYGIGPSFEKAHLAAWDAWRRDHGSELPRGCSMNVFGRAINLEAEEHAGMARRVMMPPRTIDALSGYTPPPFDPDSSPEEMEEEIKGGLDDITATADRFFDFMNANPNNRAEARTRLFYLVRDLLDLDEIL